MRNFAIVCVLLYVFLAIMFLATGSAYSQDCGSDDVVSVTCEEDWVGDLQPMQNRLSGYASYGYGWDDTGNEQSKIKLGVSISRKVTSNLTAKFSMKGQRTDTNGRENKQLSGAVNFHYDF